MPVWTSPWPSGRSRPACSPRPPAARPLLRRPPTRRWRLEALEDRCVPAVTIPGTPGDDTFEFTPVSTTQVQWVRKDASGAVQQSGQFNPASAPVNISGGGGSDLVVVRGR